MIKCKFSFFLISICIVTIVESQESEIVTETLLSGETLPETTESATDSIIDAVATAQESSDTIKPQNRDKCDKCLKMSFRYRHGNFCSKCDSNNFLNNNTNNNINNADNIKINNNRTVSQ